MRAVFDLLLRIQSSCGIRLLLIGGWALQAHGYSRQTADVDCMTAIEDESRIADELGKAGFERFDALPAFKRYRHRVNPLLVLDLMEVDTATFKKMWDQSQPFEIEDLTLRVPALAHMIALKLHAARNEHRAARDLADIVQLLSVNAGKVSAAKLRELCAQFGTAESLQSLKAFL